LADSEEKPAAPIVWLVRTKVDLLPSNNESKANTTRRNEPIVQGNKALKSMVNKGLTCKSEPTFTSNDLEFSISAVTGVGFEGLLQALAQFAESHLTGAESTLITRERHRRALQDTQAALTRALSEPAAGREDLIAEELRIAARALGRLTGRVDVEDILDVIFRDFCIGK
jgi:tRNA modification GTPase